MEFSQRESLGVHNGIESRKTVKRPMDIIDGLIKRTQIKEENR